MSFQRLLLLVVALGREESDASFGCTKTHGDKDRPRVSLLLVLPLTHPALPWRGSVFVDLLCLNINPEKKRPCFSSELIHFPACPHTGWVSTVQEERTGMERRAWMQWLNLHQPKAQLSSLLPEYAPEKSDATHCFAEGSVSMDQTCS